MGIETDLNVAPYYDDANNAIQDNYHRILFRPAVAVQARELTQIQDILQNQIERFGDNIFLAGTIIKGCNFSFDANYYYTKILDLRPLDGQPANPSQYVGLLAREATSNLYAVCVNYQDGFESQDPNLKTLYFKYINSGINNQQAFTAGSSLQFYTNTDPTYANSTNYFANGDVKIATVANAVGTGYSMSVSSGIVFQKGHFIQVANNTSVIVSKYNNTPSNVAVGFNITENIITELQDSNLYDAAAGYSNFNAPGAHRLQLIPTLAAYSTNAIPTTNFLSLVEWTDGNITKSAQKTQYSELGNELARRTFEESGNYFIKPFNLYMANANSTYNYAITTAGLAYIEGHRVEQLNNIKTPVRKGTDTKTVTNQIINTNFNNSILVQEYVGNIPGNIGASVSIRDTAGSSISTGPVGTISAPGIEIGTAKVLAVIYESGSVGTPVTQYRVYLADINMNSGRNLRDARAIYYSGGNGGLADTVLTYDSTSNSNITVLYEPSKAALIFKTSKKGLKGLASTGTLPTYTYRTVSNTLINYTTGNSNIITLTGSDQFPYGQGALNSVQEQEIIIIPTSFTSGANNANVTLASTGTVVITNGSANVTANASNTTAFTSQYQVGDYINAGLTIRRITNIANDTLMIVDRAYAASNTNATHAKTYPVGVPVNIADRNSRATIVDSNSKQLQISLLSVANTAETLTANMNISVYTNIIIPSDSDRSLQANTSVAVRLNLANNSAAATGPWCLGVPYAYNLKAVYRSSNTGTFFANTQSGNTYVVTNTAIFGANGAAISGYGIPAGATANVANSTALVLSSAATATIANGQLTYGYYSNAVADDITSAFYIQDGQRDAFFDQSFLVKNPNYKNIGLNSSDLLTVVFDAFKPQNTGKGYISVDSYTTLVNGGQIGYENVPAYTDLNGTYYELRDSIDFRVFCQNTAAYQTLYTNSVINPAYTSLFPTSENYIVAPNKTFVYSTEYYIGRIDKLTMNSYGAYSVVEGLPSETPSAPADKNGSMTLATLVIPPYPSLASTTLTSNTAKSYLVTTTVSSQNRVYTMKDIAKLDKRVNNLEYYTSLSLLEQQTSTLMIPSSVTKANRFKNGIFVDNYTGTDALDVENSEFRAALSPSETSLVPRTASTTVQLRFSTGANTTVAGNFVTLAPAGDLYPFIQQKYGSDTRQCTDNYYQYVGRVKLSPSYASTPDFTGGQVPLLPATSVGQLKLNVVDDSSNVVFDGYTGTGAIPGGFLQLYSAGVQDIASYLNRILGTSLATWKPFLAGRRATGFTMTQTGYFIAPETGTYTFTVVHDNGFSLTVGSATTSSTTYSTDTLSGVSLTAGQYYYFKFVLTADTSGNTAGQLSFAVNGNTYTGLTPTGGQKSILNTMFARDNTPDVSGSASGAAFNSTVTTGITTVPGYDTTNIITVPTTSVLAPVPTVTTSLDVKPILKDQPAGGGGGAHTEYVFDNNVREV
jgi:hypothetical protein